MTAQNTASSGTPSQPNPSQGSGRFTLTEGFIAVTSIGLLSLTLGSLPSTPRARSQASLLRWKVDASHTNVACDTPPVPGQSEKFVVSVRFFDVFQGDVDNLSPIDQGEVKARQSHLIFYKSEYDSNARQLISAQQADQLFNHDWSRLMNAATEAGKTNPHAVSPEKIQDVIHPPSVKPISLRPQYNPHLAYMRQRAGRIF